MKAGMESTVSSTCFHNTKKDFEKAKHGWTEINRNTVAAGGVNVPGKACVKIPKSLEYLYAVPKDQ